MTYEFRRRGRKSVRELRSDSLAAQRMYASGMAPDDPRREAAQAFLAKQAAAIPPKRHRIRRPVDGKPANDIEASVINAVGDLLHVHPKVLFAVRQNTGSMPYESHGRMVPVWFYKLVRKPGDVTIVDFWGFLADRRPFAFECKRPSWKPASPANRIEYARELKQETFLHMIRSLGGIASFVTDADQLAALLA